MGITNCPGCGAPVTAGAQYCAYCGAAVSPVAPPRTGTGSPEPLSFPGLAPPTPYAPIRPPPPRRRSKFLVVMVIVVVVFLVAGAVGYLFLVTAPPPVQVSEIDIYSPDNVCGLAAMPIYYSGFNSSTGVSQVYDFGVPNFNGSACTIRAVGTNSSGFSVTAAQVPLTIPSGTNVSMNITIQSPSSGYAGALALLLT